MSRAGSVFRRGSGWGYRLDLSPPGAPRNQRMQQGFRTKREAQEALDEAKGQLASGTFVAPANVTVSEWTDRWAASLVAKGLAPSTRNDYLSKVKTYLLPELGERSIQSIVGSDLDSLYATMLCGGARDGSPLSPRTVRAFHVVARLLFEHAVRHGVLIRNPVRSATPPSTTAAAPGEPKVWSHEELAQFLQANQGTSRYPEWRVLALTGLRRGELIGLRWGDVDLDDRTIRVRRAVAVVNGELTIGQPKSQRSKRVVAVDSGTAEVLCEHAGLQRERLELVGIPVDGDTPVFDNGVGEILHADALASAFRRAVKRAQVPKIRMHDLRHTHASHLVAAGQSMRVVSERLGHSSVSFTMDTYAHVMPGQQDHAAALAAKLVDSMISSVLSVIAEAATSVHGDIVGLLSDIIVFEGQRLRGASAPSFFGAVLLREPPGSGDDAWVWFADHLSREASHHRLYLACAMDPLVMTDPKVTSPVREDPRPLSGVLHALWVETRLVQLFDSLVPLQDALPLRDSDRVQQKLDEVDSLRIRGLDTVSSHSNSLTAVGRELLDACSSLQVNHAVH